MTEEEARAWIDARYAVSRGTLLNRFAELLISENERQNLISRSTVASVWGRHIVDSAQLVALAPPDGRWLDVGSGGGLPGIVVAILRDQPVVLVEPRAKRAAFLADVAEVLDLGHVEVLASKVEQMKAGPFAVISARAVASLDGLLRSTVQLADKGTLWLLPKGRSAQSEVEAARRSWQGAFHVKQSVTDPASGIVTVSGARRR